MKGVASVASLTVRPLETDADVETFFRLCVRTFWPEADQATQFDWWYRFVTQTPGFEPRHVHAAFRGAEMVGGCVVHERTLLVPPAGLRTSCIALVATHADYRRQGIARAVIEEVIRSAQDREHDLLLLGGIPNFYDQFGFVDIFDSTQHFIDRGYILAQPQSPYRVRPAALEDASALLELYTRHHQAYPGSFTRTVEEQRHRLRFRPTDNPPLLVLSPDGEPRGYLMCASATARERADEVAADTWPAALALLQYQAHLLDGRPDPPAEIVWTLAPTSPTLYHLLDNTRFPSITPLPPYPNWYVMHSQRLHLPVAGWMARPASLPVLIRNLLPRWNMRQRTYVPEWPGTLELAIGDQTFLLGVRQGELQLVERAVYTQRAVRLTEGAFTQLLFGFRPVTWIARQPEQEIPEEMIPLLEGLFPPGQTWIAASDAF